MGAEVLEEAGAGCDVVLVWCKPWGALRVVAEPRRVRRGSDRCVLVLGRGNTSTTPADLVNPGGTPLRLYAKPGAAPLSVNSAVQVPGLNASLLGGARLADLQRRVGGTCLQGAAVAAVAVDGSVRCTTPLQGAAGPAGEAGSPGPAGSPGAVGAAGPPGPLGAVGAVGAVGAAGAVGAVGAVGPAGPPGPAGVKGDVGPSGPAGRQGDVGPAGPAGAPGVRGDIGPGGPAGVPGAGASLVPPVPRDPGERRCGGTRGSGGATGPTAPGVTGTQTDTGQVVSVLRLQRTPVASLDLPAGTYWVQGRTTVEFLDPVMSVAVSRWAPRTGLAARTGAPRTARGPRTGPPSSLGR